jgi:F-type H+-transporting ATPase subunit b
MEALGINLGLLIVQIIAFTIVFLTLNAWVYQPMLNMMETRKQKIAQGLEDARVAADARSSAEKDAAKIIAEAQVEASKIVKEATDRAATAGKDVKLRSNAIAFLVICVVKLPHSPWLPPINWLVKRLMKRNSAHCSMSSSRA